MCRIYIRLALLQALVNFYRIILLFARQPTSRISVREPLDIGSHATPEGL